MNNIYQTEKYKAFCICEEYKEVVKKIYNIEPLIVVNDGYFLSIEDLNIENSVKFLLSNQIFTMEDKNLEICFERILPFKNYFVGKIINTNTSIDQDESHQEKYAQFQEELIKLQINWLRRFASCIYEHLKNRVSGFKALTSHSIIRATFSEVITLLNVMDELVDIKIKNVEKLEQLLINITKKIYVTSDYLLKLAGGRAFLRGNLVEMLWIFKLLNSVYL